MATGELLIGRDPMLGVLEAALEDARGGHGQLMLVTGEPGIGKSALITAAAASATRQGARVLWAQCWDGPGAPPYWPWTQVLRAGLQAGEPVELGEAGRLDVEFGMNVSRSSGAEPEGARFRLFDAVARVLARLAAVTPLVVVLDDLQWADEASLRLLDFAARHLRISPVLIVGAYRDVEAGSGLQRIAGTGQVLPLSPLTPPQVAALMAAVTDAAPPPALAGKVWRRTGGNPLFVRELTRLMTVPDSGVSDPVPAITDSIRDTLERRLACLSRPCTGMLAAAAVAGPEVRRELLARVLGDRVDLAEVLAEAVAARVLLEPGEPFTPYRFTHDLFRETLYAGLAAAPRTRLHLDIGQTLEALREEGVPIHAAELAAHFVAVAAAGVTAVAGRAVSFSRLAAEDATGRLGYEEARAHYERALRALDVTAELDLAVRLDLLLGLGEARNRAGDAAGAHGVYREALVVARKLGDGAAVARAAVGVHALGVPTGLSRDVNVALLEEAAAASSVAPALRARVLAGLARELHHSYESRNMARAPAVADQAVALARGADDPAALAFCLLALHDARWAPGTARQRLPLVEEMHALAVAAGDWDLAAQTRLLRATALLERGDPEGRAELAAYCQSASELGHARGRWGALSRRAALAALDGRLDDAAAASEEARRLGESIGEPDSYPVWLCQQWELARFAARRHEVVFERATRFSVVWQEDYPAVRAIRLVELGDRPAARATLSGFDPDTGLARPGQVRRSHDALPLAMNAEALALAGSDMQRRRMYETLRPLAGDHVVAGGSVVYLGAVDHYLGLLAAALGRRDDAARHLRAAVIAHERLGASPWVRLSREQVAGGPAHAPSYDVNVFRRDGDVWTITYCGHSIHLPDAKGLQDLAGLLAIPGAAIPAVQLQGRLAVTGADPVLDSQARAEYRARLAELDAEIDDAENAHDPHAAEHTRAERDWLRDELAKATGLAGRGRRLGDERERARKAVTARIRDAIARIERLHPGLGAHLRASITTGTYCSYRTEPTTRWTT
jgi:tetratricopeptide (TPR) repeat protein